MKSAREIIDECLHEYRLKAENYNPDDIYSNIINALESERYIIVPEGYADSINKLKQIAEIYNHLEDHNDGHSTMDHAGYNFSGALIDLKHEGKPDKVIMDTFERVQNQLVKIANVLGTLVWPEGR